MLAASSQWYRATHAFDGDAGQSQLSFSIGEIIEVRQSRQSQGWEYGYLNSSAEGWFPLAFTVPSTAPASELSTSPHTDSAIPTRVRDSFRTTGEAIQGSFRKAGQGISIAAAKTSQGISDAASKTGQAISNATAANPGKQTGANVANGAARGAIATGALAALRGGSLSRGMANGAVLGGALGAAKNWKPFG